MQKHQIGLKIFVGLFLLGPKAAYGRSIGEQQRSGFTVAVCDRAGMDSNILASAGQTTTRILGSAGVAINWVELDSRSKCGLPSAEGGYFVVVILREAPKGWTSLDALGFAPNRTNSPRAYVFQGRLQTVVDHLVGRERRRWGMGILLGHAIAHELGHLWIPGDGHAPYGIMSSQWYYRQWEDAVAGKLLFSEEQAKAIQRRFRGK